MHYAALFRDYSAVIHSIHRLIHRKRPENAGFWRKLGDRGGLFMGKPESYPQNRAGFRGVGAGPGRFRTGFLWTPRGEVPNRRFWPSMPQNSLNPVVCGAKASAIFETSPAQRMHRTRVFSHRKHQGLRLEPNYSIPSRPLSRAAGSALSESSATFPAIS